MWQIQSSVRHYDWGHESIIPELMGLEADGRPWAELWMGAHPDEPSLLPDGRGLDAAIADDPAGLLGEPVRRRFGDRLPFLMKVLAAGSPLSLQAHPTKAQAEAGFAAEEEAGVPRDDPTRTYKDANHKPEILCALTPVEALCGFRPVEESLHCLAKLQLPELKPTIAALARGGLKVAVPQLLALSGRRRESLVAAVAERAAASVAANDPEFVNTYRWAARLAEKYPGDPGVVISLMCNHLTLEPGEAVFLPAGNLHAYLAGSGVELMANSDNVLRGGLTPKHIDLAALVEVLDFTDGKVPVLRPVLGPGGLRYPVPIDDFDLTRVAVDTAPGELTTPGPQILLCVEQTAVLEAGGEQITLAPGGAAFVAAGQTVHASGPAVLFRATTALL
ncbi:mannose-6-phosphate isomerase, class I [Klenkia sp. PcliD-1-E]|uniref:mannose-6-phosphate isomerase, class I n=1 Tax=Klenkia sp. PcliD-1-E TaxID=2954492 RepID=UPI0020985D84|nr:mannose-6-phosphate isomerase, class I [Klenkia sp. PcliD-1-E]MCO7219971.1 mannose-6-phosphate isomerase, class I [Klenkia sp. PcliD-1-E]